MLDSWKEGARLRKGDPIVWTLEEVAEAVRGDIVGDAATTITTVSSDTRSLEQGALFVALKGPRFDGHDYLRQALESGATALLVNEAPPSIGPGRGAVVVVDTLAAMQSLAKWHRRRMPALVLGLTGSVGKTTTKELVASIVSQEGPTLATQGNLNNHIGVPLTLLRLRPEHRFAVIEMGCNGFGEIALLAELAAPTIGLVTKVAAAHLEGLGDLAGVARAKGELLVALPPSGIAVINLDDERVEAMSSPATTRLGYGRSEGARARLLERTPEPSGAQRLRLELVETKTVIQPRLKLLGRHNALNATAAAAMALAAGIDPAKIEAGLEAAEPVPGRLNLVHTPSGLRVIDDSYNANPESVAAALEVTEEHKGEGRAQVLLGEMAELGAERDAAHRAAGARAASCDPATFIAVGAMAEAMAAGALEAGMDRAKVFVSESPDEAGQLVQERSSRGDLILVKGSRVARMERAVALLNRPDGNLEREVATC